MFVPDAAVTLRRVPGKWHPIFHIIAMIALPLIYSVYVGVAAAARDRVMQLAIKRRTDEHLCYMAGGLENEITCDSFSLSQTCHQFRRRSTLAQLLSWSIDPHKIFTAST